MNETIQHILEQMKKHYHDYRVNLFKVEVSGLDERHLTLSGRVLEQENLERLLDAVKRAFPQLSVDTSGVRVLRQPGNPILAVSTNLSSLHQTTSFLSEQYNQFVYGTRLEVLEEKDSWVFVRQMDRYLGWTYRPYLSERLPVEPTHIVLAPCAPLFQEPDAGSQRLTRVLCGAWVRLLERRGDWAKIEANQTGWLPFADLRSPAQFPSGDAERRRMMVADAQRMTGVPYLWGGSTGNGIDCSGLAQLLHAWIGITLPRDADMQMAAGRRVEAPFAPGDLVFFGDKDAKGGIHAVTHVSLSLGGWVIVHSSRARNGVYVDDIQAVPHLKESFLGGCSLLPE